MGWNDDFANKHDKFVWFLVAIPTRLVPQTIAKLLHITPGNYGLWLRKEGLCSIHGVKLNQQT